MVKWTEEVPSWSTSLQVGNEDWWPEASWNYVDNAPGGGVDFLLRLSIDTLDSYDQRELKGNLRIVQESGDLGVADFTFSRYPLVSKFDLAAGESELVSVGWHSGCGLHTWHDQLLNGIINPRKPGSAVYRIEFDPLADAYGDGAPSVWSYIAVSVPEFEEHRLEFKMFIPCEVVMMGSYETGAFLRAFKADNRVLGPGLGLDFGGKVWPETLGSKAAVLREWVLSEGEVPFVANPKEYPAADFLEFGETVEFDMSSVNTDTGYCLHTLTANPVVVDQATLDADDSTLGLYRVHPDHAILNGLDWEYTSAWRDGANYEGARVETYLYYLRGGDPLVWKAPPVEAFAFIQIIDLPGNRSCLRILNESFMFPSHEIYFDGRAVFKFDAEDAGTRPAHLFNSRTKFGRGELINPSE